MTAHPPAADHSSAVSTMSLLAQLAQRLRTIANDLPLPHVLRASQALHTASGLLTYVLQTSSRPTALPRLAAAEEHLGHAARAIWAARDAIEEYLTSIGIASEGIAVAPPPRAVASAPAGAASSAEPPPVDAVAGLTDWWATRVDELTDHGDGTPEARRTSGDTADTHVTDPEATLRELTRLAQTGDRGGYRDALVATSPATGLRLPALGVAVLRDLASERLGRRPTAGDLDDLCAVAVPRARTLLPRLDERVPTALLAEICHFRRGDLGANAAHPVDVAVTYPPLIAGLLSAVGRDDIPSSQQLAGAGAVPRSG